MQGELHKTQSEMHKAQTDCGSLRLQLDVVQEKLTMSADKLAFANDKLEKAAAEVAAANATAANAEEKAKAAAAAAAAAATLNAGAALAVPTPDASVTPLSPGGPQGAAAPPLDMNHMFLTMQAMKITLEQLHAAHTSSPPPGGSAKKPKALPMSPAEDNVGDSANPPSDTAEAKTSDLASTSASTSAFTSTAAPVNKSATVGTNLALDLLDGRSMAPHTASTRGSALVPCRFQCNNCSQCVFSDDY